MQWSFSLNNFGVHLILQSWRWFLRCCLVVVSSKGTHKVEQICTHKKNKNKKQENPTKGPKFKYNTISVSFSACRCSLVVFSSKVGRKKKKIVWRQFCEWYLWLWAVSCLPAAVSLLLLEALFMQISGVSLALTCPCRPCLLRVLCVSLCYKLSPFKAHWGRWNCTMLSQACVFVYSSHGKWVFSPLLWSFPPITTFTSFLTPDYWAVLLLLPAACGKWVFPHLLWSFPPSTTLTSFPSPGCWACTSAPARVSLAHPACLFTVPGRIPFPQLQHSVRPNLFPVCLYCSYCLLLSFSFFPWWRSVCPGGYAALAWGCLWEYRDNAKLTLSTSSQAVWVGATGSPGALLVSLFNVKWRCSVLAGGVAGSKFCLFSVVLPAGCVSSVSPRFHYRRHAFCILPLNAIFQFSWCPPK
jgi:hypothetical protein